MAYEILRNGSPFIAEQDYCRNSIQLLFQKLGLNPDQAPHSVAEKTHVATLTFMPVEEIKPALGAFERVSAHYTRAVYENKILYLYEAQALSMEEIREQRHAELDAVHERYETGYLTYQSCLIKFDLKARVNAAGLVKGFEEGTISATDWHAKQRVEGADAEDEEAPLVKVLLPITTLEQARLLLSAMITAINRGYEAKKQIRTALETADEQTLRSYVVSRSFQTQLDAL